MSSLVFQSTSILPDGWRITDPGMVEIPYIGYTYLMAIVKTAQLNLIKTLFPFSLLDDVDLRKIAPFFVQTKNPAGATIYSDGYPASDFFFILSGSVKITVHHKKSDQDLGLLSEGDHFGEESLSSQKTYLTRAVCSSEVTVLRLKRNKCRSIMDAYPQIRNAFTLFQKTFHLACSEKLSWRNDTEGIELFSRRHPIFLFFRIFLISSCTLLAFSFIFFAALASANFFTPLLILSIFILVVGGGLCAWAGLEWTNDYFILTQDRVSVQRKLIGFYDSRHESPVNAILSVGIDTSLWGRLFDYGTVTVRTYTGDLRFARLPYPYLIYELLEIRRQYATIQASQAEKREIREALVGKPDPEKTQKIIRPASTFKPQNDPVEQSNSISDLLARFFNLRVVKEDSVVYRTHWWILVRKTTLPALFLVAIVLVVLARLVGFFEVIPAVAVYMVSFFLSLAGWGWWIYQFQDWQNDLYILTDDQLIDVYKKPLGSEDRRSAPVKNIQTVEFERKGLINLILNFGTVKIKIGNEELSFDNVYQPSQVQNEIYSRYRAFLDTAKKTEQQRFVEWIKTYDEIKKETETSDEPPNEEEKG